MSSSGEQKSSLLTKFPLTKEHHKAEIIWTLKSIMSHFFYNSAHNITVVFKAMFPSRSIAQHMSCDPTKLSYLISFGIAPYFRELLLADIKKASCFVVSLMNHTIMNYKRNRWTSLLDTLRMTR